MENYKKVVVLAVWTIAAGCSSKGDRGGGGGGGPGNSTSLTGNLQVSSVTPPDGATQVDPGVQIRVKTDGVLVAECLQDSLSRLEGPGQSTVAGAFAVEDGTTIVFTPAQTLRNGEDYVFHLSPFTCDTGARILDSDFEVRFRTFDNVPPAVTSVSSSSGAAIGQGQAGIPGADPLTVQLTEDVVAASLPGNIALIDAWGGVHRADAHSQATRIVVDPLADLPGDTAFTLVLRGGQGGIEDTAGNTLPRNWTLSFRTAPDTTPPVLVSVWPGPGTGSGSLGAVTRHVHPVLVFDESVDPASVEPSSVLFFDDVSSFVPFTVQTGLDQRTLRLVPQAPLQLGRTYTIQVAGGASGITDVSGNPTIQGKTVTFVVGPDEVAPALLSSVPATGSASISLNASPALTFDEPLDTWWVSGSTVRLWNGSAEVPVSVAIANGDTEIVITPDEDLESDTTYVAQVLGGTEGVRDVAGNAMPGDVTVTFRTSDDPTLPSVLLAPNDGNSAVPTSVDVSAMFDQPIDPATVDDTTVFLTGPGGTVSGTLTVERGDRVIRLAPLTAWIPGSWYTFTVLGGVGGVREASGNWLAGDETSQFRIAFAADAIAPAVSITFNGTSAQRNQFMTVPPSGFEIEVQASDLPHYSLDMSSAEVELRGSATVPGATPIFLAAQVNGSKLTYRLPAGSALAPGNYTATGTVSDLSGNKGASPVLNFQVADADVGALPFERTQVVQVRFELDRDGNGRSDTQDDLYRLGLMAPGDPLGTNQRMLDTVRDGILAHAHALLGRSPSGAPLSADAVPVRFLARRPLGLVPSEIAVGGLDPTGDPSRVYGSQATGTLGRAFFDYRNGDMADLCTATNPGLGVFPGELFLFEAKIHLQVYPTFTTAFGRSFINLVPAMGGTPAGEHRFDSVVLAPNFNYASASPQHRGRYAAVFGATDEWATAIAVLLAHEVGHMVGLVAQGDNPRGLHGDASLHNELPSAIDVMAPALGYDSMVALGFRFRDLNLSFLQQTLLMK